MTACDAPSSWVNHAVEVHVVGQRHWLRRRLHRVRPRRRRLGEGRQRAHPLSTASTPSRCAPSTCSGITEAAKTYTVRIDTVGPTTVGLANASVGGKGRKGHPALSGERRPQPEGQGDHPHQDAWWQAGEDAARGDADDQRGDQLALHLQPGPRAGTASTWRPRISPATLRSKKGYGTLTVR